MALVIINYMVSNLYMPLVLDKISRSIYLPQIFLMHDNNPLQYKTLRTHVMYIICRELASDHAPWDEVI